MIELLFLLLPVAAASGWWLGWRSGNGKGRAGSQPMPGDYFKGLNYLINEQPDRAIDIFTRMLEVNSETLEVHFALASLFLRRGEVDRAIRIHQNIMARPDLTKEQLSYTLYQLGKDYLRAGVLDRAEGIFSDLVHDADHGLQSQRRLIEIYQQEREWGKAIDVARHLSRRSGEKMHSQIAHFYCELAMKSIEANDPEQALKVVQEALSFDHQCARTSIIEGSILQGQKKFLQAVRAYQRIESQDVTLLTEVTGPIAACYRELSKPEDAREYFGRIQKKHPSLNGALTLAALTREVAGDSGARQIIMDYVRAQPAMEGLLRLLEVENARNAEVEETRKLMLEIVERCLEGKARYGCRQCGFSSQNLYWQCPGCKRWDTVRPLEAIWSK